MGAVDVTGAGGATREVEEGDSEDEAVVDVDASDAADEVIGGAPDTAEVLDSD
jgi:hypothetical protein